MNFLQKARAFTIVIFSVIAGCAASAAPCQFTGINWGEGSFGNTQPPGSEQKPGYSYPPQADMDYFMSKGMNIVRLGFIWERLQTTLYSSFNPIELAQINASVLGSTAKGMYVVLDPHCYARYFEHIIGTKEVPVAAFADFWSRLAKIYSHNTHVIFGLMNEPCKMRTADWFPSAQAAINAIRATGATNLILVPGNFYSGANSWTTAGGEDSNAKVMAAITDPGNNYAFEVHQYVDSGSGGCSDIWKDDPNIGKQRLAVFTNWARANKRRGFLGEFAVANCRVTETDIGAATITNMVSHMEENSDVWLGWTWWSAGFHNYIFTIDPERTASGGAIDQPVMRPLSKFVQPRVPPLAAPTVNETKSITNSGFTANWNSVAGASGYQLDVSSTNTFSTFVPGYQVFDTGTDRSVNVFGLTAGTTYYYRVRAYSEKIMGVNSLAASVTMLPSATTVYQWTGATSSAFNSAANWNERGVSTFQRGVRWLKSSSNAPNGTTLGFPPFNGTYDVSLLVNGPNDLLYTASLGTTVYASNGSLGLMIGGGSSSGALHITGGTLSTVGASAPVVLDSGALTVDAGAITIGDSGLSLGVNNAGTAVLTVNGGTATILGSLNAAAAAATINLNGGTLTSNGFSATDTTTLNFNGGTYQVGAGTLWTRGAITPMFSGFAKICIKRGGATIDTNGIFPTLTQPLFTDSVSIGGGLTKIGMGWLMLTASNSYSGPTTVKEGMLIVSNPNALGSGSTISVLDHAPGLQPVGITPALQLKNAITVRGKTAIIAGTGDNGFGALQADSWSCTWAGPVLLGANSPTLGALWASKLTVTGAISDGSTNALSISGQNGSGVVVLSPSTANAYTGYTNIFQGILRLGKTNALPTSTILDVKSDASIVKAAIFDLAGYNQTVAGLTGSIATNGTNGIITNSVASSTGTLTVANSASDCIFPGSINDTPIKKGTVVTGTGVVALVKMGSGKLTLAGTNSYTGPTTVSRGTLVISGNVTNTASVTVAAGAQLHVSGQLFSAGNIVNTGTLVFTGSAQFGAAGTITNYGTIINLAVSLTLPAIVNHGRLLQTPPVIISASAIAGINGMAFSYQITATRGPTVFAATGLPAGLSVNTRTGLIWGKPTVTGAFSPTISASGPYRTGTAALTINVLPPGAKTWTGVIGGRWDTITANWTGATTRFYNNDNVIFTDNARTNAISIAPGTTVASAIFNPTAACCSLSGALACNGFIVQNGPGIVDFGAALSGSGGVIVNSGTLTLSGPNTYKGPTIVNGGILKVGNSRCLSGASALTLNSGGVLDLNSISLQGPGQVVFNGGTLLNSGTGSPRLNCNSINACSGTIATGIGGWVALTKSTTGTLFIDSDLSCGGKITINEGTVKLAGKISMDVVVNRGTFIQTGSVKDRSVTINSGGVYGPSESPSIRLFSGNGGSLVLNPGGVMHLLITGKKAGTDYDQIQPPPNGSVILSGSLILTATAYLPVGGVYTIINNSLNNSGDTAAALTGTFTGLPEGAQFQQSNQWWRISYVAGKGHDVTITRIDSARLR